METNFNLSEKIVKQNIVPEGTNCINVNGCITTSWRMDLLTIQDVKEFIKLLKGILIDLEKDDRHTDDYRRGMKSCLNFINKLAGEKLNGN